MIEDNFRWSKRKGLIVTLLIVVLVLIVGYIFIKTKIETSDTPKLDVLYTSDFLSKIDLSTIKVIDTWDIPVYNISYIEGKGGIYTYVGYKISVVEVNGVEKYVFYKDKIGVLLEPTNINDDIKYIAFILNQQRYIFSITKFTGRKWVITFNRYGDNEEFLSEVGPCFNTCDFNFNSRIENKYSLTPLYGYNNNDPKKWETNIDLITIVNENEDINPYKSCPPDRQRYCLSIELDLNSQLKFMDLDLIKEKLVP